MREIFLAALLLLGSAGCATTSAQYGNLVPNTASVNDKKIANDVIKQILPLYPPASTRFNLQHPTSDFFGTYLIDVMRGKGYAISEFKPVGNGTGTTGPAPGPTTGTGLPFAYVLDQAAGPDLYRIRVVINQQQSLDRVYQLAKDGAIYPASYWVRKE